MGKSLASRVLAALTCTFYSVIGESLGIPTSLIRRCIISVAHSFTMRMVEPLKVFVVYSNDDSDKATQVCNLLENNGYICVGQHSTYAFPLGQPIITCINETIAKCDRMLLILTDKSADSHWVSLETILALEQSMRRNHLLLRVLMFDVKKDDAKAVNLRKRLLSCIPHAEEEYFWTTEDDHEGLIKQLRAVHPIDELLPVGSLAHGLVFSHFFGYLNYIAEDMETILHEQGEDNNQDIFPLKFYQLLPTSCQIRGTLETSDKEEECTGISIKEEKTLRFEKTHAGKPRKFVLTIYRIMDISTRESFLFCGGYSSSFSTIHKLAEKGLAKIDVKLEYSRFLHTYETLVHHNKLKTECRDRIEILSFDDTKAPAPHLQLLFASIKKDVERNRTALTQATEGRTKSLVDMTLPIKDERVTCDAVVYASDDDQEEQAVAGEISNFLEQHKKTVQCPMAGRSQLDFPKSRWFICVMSQKSLESNHLTRFCCMSQIHQGIECDTVRVIPILIDCDIMKIPSFIKWITFFKTSTEGYKENLLQILNGEPMKMTSKLPTGDVVTGLAWAFLFNYLEIAIPPTDDFVDLRGRIKDFLRRNDLHDRCLVKFFIIWPKSCETGEDLHKKINDSAGSGNAVEYIGPLDPVEDDVAGQKGRRFHLHMFRYTENNVRVCFLAEHCSVNSLLYNMVHEPHFKFAGITKDQMYRQGVEFKEKLEEILGREKVIKEIGDFTDVVKIIYYNDEDGIDSLMDVLQSENGLDITNIDKIPSNMFVTR